MSRSLDRLNRLSRLIALGAKGLMVIFGILIGVALVVVIVSASMGADAVLNLSPDDTITGGQVIVMGIALLMMGIFLFALMYHIRRLFWNIYKSNTPFTDESVKQLYRIGSLTLVGAIVLPIVGGAAAAAYDVAVGSLSFSPFSVFTAFMIYFIALVFRYGTELQKESDEML